MLCHNLKIKQSFQKKNKSEAQRSFAVGTISECFSALKQQTSNFIHILLPTFLKLVDDPNAEVRNNAIYGIGELALHSNAYMYPSNISYLII